MNRVLLRFIAVLLVVCLVIDPAAAAVFTLPGSLRPPPSIPSEAFRTQAVNTAVEMVLHPLTSRAGGWIRRWTDSYEWVDMTLAEGPDGRTLQISWPRRKPDIRPVQYQKDNAAADSSTSNTAQNKASRKPRLVEGPRATEANIKIAVAWLNRNDIRPTRRTVAKILGVSYGGFRQEVSRKGIDLEALGVVRELSKKRAIVQEKSRRVSKDVLGRIRMIERVEAFLSSRPHAWWTLMGMIKALGFRKKSQATRNRILNAALELSASGHAEHVGGGVQGLKYEFHYLPVSLEQTTPPITLSRLINRIYPIVDRTVNDGQPSWPRWALYDWHALKGDYSMKAFVSRAQILIRLVSIVTGQPLVRVSLDFGKRIWQQDSKYLHLYLNQWGEVEEPLAKLSSPERYQASQVVTGLADAADVPPGVLMGKTIAPVTKGVRSRASPRSPGTNDHRHTDLSTQSVFNREIDNAKRGLLGEWRQRPGFTRGHSLFNGPPGTYRSAEGRGTSSGGEDTHTAFVRSLLQELRDIVGSHNIPHSLQTEEVLQVALSADRLFNDEESKSLPKGIRRELARVFRDAARKWRKRQSASGTHDIAVQSFSAVIKQADTFEEEDNMNQAAALFVLARQKAATGSPEYWRASFGVIRCLLATGKFQEAIDTLKKALPPKITTMADVEGACLLARAYRNVGQFDNARQLLRRNIDWLKVWEARPAKAGQKSSQIQQAKETRALFAKNYYEQGRLYVALRMRESALRALRGARELSLESSLNVRERAAINSELMTALVYCGDYAPEDQDYRDARGFLQESIQWIKEFRVSAEQAAEVRPVLVDRLIKQEILQRYLLVMTVLQPAGWLAEAENEFLAILEFQEGLDEDFLDAVLHSLAWAQFNLGDVAAAKNSFNHPNFVDGINGDVLETLLNMRAEQRAGDVANERGVEVLAGDPHRKHKSRSRARRVQSEGHYRKALETTLAGFWKFLSQTEVIREESIPHPDTFPREQMLDILALVNTEVAREHLKGHEEEVTELLLALGEMAADARWLDVAEKVFERTVGYVPTLRASFLAAVLPAHLRHDREALAKLRDIKARVVELNLPLDWLSDFEYSILDYAESTNEIRRRIRENYGVKVGHDPLSVSLLDGLEILDPTELAKWFDAEGMEDQTRLTMIEKAFRNYLSEINLTLSRRAFSRLLLAMEKAGYHFSVLQIIAMMMKETGAEGKRSTDPAETIATWMRQGRREMGERTLLQKTRSLLYVETDSMATGAAWLPYAWYRPWAWMETPISAGLTAAAAAGLWHGGLWEWHHAGLWVWFLFPAIFYLGHIFKNREAMLTLDVGKLTLAKLAIASLPLTILPGAELLFGVIAAIGIVHIARQHWEIQRHARGHLEAMSFQDKMLELRLDIPLSFAVLASFFSLGSYLGVYPAMFYTGNQSSLMVIAVFVCSAAAILGLLFVLYTFTERLSTLAQSVTGTPQARTKSERARKYMWVAVMISILGQMNLIILWLLAWGGLDGGGRRGWLGPGALLAAIAGIFGVSGFHYIAGLFAGWLRERSSRSPRHLARSLWKAA